MSAATQSHRIVSDSAEATRAHGEALGRRLRAGDRVNLVGPLGAGKTVFVQGIARGMGLAADFPVTSPTYARMNLYPTDPPLYHWDLYRVSDGAAADAELSALGFGDEVAGPGVVVVEWADRGEQATSDDVAILVRLSYGETPDERIIEITT
ncbi:MAG: tRNA (adenosine(37)-N6)-threonylcarbamoyltransferase complex ATPase subunit type 1 TsaE [Deltaproteobacteria bacterium]|nr:tRNA (adenosine(37)-N6)-threonylcarbamoyltransferase complex ATPase subunit type 1 TsaE [Deltaproteobacteria bacterium]